MQVTPRRLIVLANLKNDIATGRITTPVLSRFLTSLSELLEQGWAGRKPEDLVPHAADAATGTTCTGQPCISNAARVSRVLDDASFARNNLEASRLALDCSDYLPSVIIAQLELSGIPNGVARGEMRTARPLAWVTTSAALKALREALANVIPGEGSAELATTTRDLLGLIHHNTDQVLIELEYPSTVLPNDALRPPTCLEGSQCIVYRSGVGPDGWGRAVDLRSGRDGIAEGVHEPLRFTEEFRVRALGRVGSAPRAWTWSDLLLTYGTPWQSADTHFLMEVGNAL